MRVGVRVRVGGRVRVGVGVGLGLGLGVANLVVALLGPLADEVCDARDVDVVESCSGLGVGLGSVVRVRVRVGGHLLAERVDEDVGDADGVPGRGWG